MSKACIKCGAIKPLDFFYKHSGAKDGRRGDCRACSLIAAKDRSGNPEFIARRIRWKNEYNKSPRRLAKIEEYNLRKYGLNKTQYDAMVSGQSNSCKICKAKHEPLKSRGRLFVDHDHATGEVRGLLCQKCNTLIGFAREDDKILLEAIVYLGVHKKKAA